MDLALGSRLHELKPEVQMQVVRGVFSTVVIRILQPLGNSTNFNTAAVLHTFVETSSY